MYVYTDTQLTPTQSKVCEPVVYDHWSCVSMWESFGISILWVYIRKVIKFWNICKLLIIFWKRAKFIYWGNLFWSYCRCKDSYCHLSCQGRSEKHTTEKVVDFKGKKTHNWKRSTYQGQRCKMGRKDSWASFTVVKHVINFAMFQNSFHEMTTPVGFDSPQLKFPCKTMIC